MLPLRMTLVGVTVMFFNCSRNAFILFLSAGEPPYSVPLSLGEREKAWLTS